ncbi:hypothetical protein [Lysobacter sp. ESA13C]|uniref:hypothetical protein n=1 Tax=Lysobacter sp. ESA13C TaxID=2862676 RepID=UPI001CBF1AA2|nr:hypothetical protein [Lysobacter sp. ESA13C]
MANFSVYTASALAGLLLAAAPPPAAATTPAGTWVLANPSPQVKDYFLRIDVDPGEQYPEHTDSASNVYFAQYIKFNNANGGYWGLQRASGEKRALVSIWNGTGAMGDRLPPVDCYEFGACSSIKGQYTWKVGHQYRMRAEASPRYGGDWWQMTLYDLTLGTAEVLGQISVPSNWGGLHKENGMFLEYFYADPYQCYSLRHARATIAPVRGNWGQDTALASFNGTAYGNPHPCDSSWLLSGMTHAGYGSISWAESDGTVNAVGNQYRGLYEWGQYNKQATAGMYFAADLSVDYPYLYRAKHNGAYGPFPPQGQSNADWQSIGRGYPVINDLYHRNQPLRSWAERNEAYVAVGDYFYYDNPNTGDLEYFTLVKKGAQYFPVDKTSNEFWTYKGRHYRKSETVPEMAIHQWGENNRYGRVGSVFKSGDKYFRLKTSSQYWYFPTTATDNNQWQFIGYHP